MPSSQDRSDRFILIGLTIALESLGMFTGTLPMTVIGILLIVIGVMKLCGRGCKCCAR